ncbi:uncharacterized protein LOC141555627 isoform X2 [Sminthopsis crassicaudata]|uniref:uncharacterized protein LOC141555627 isoform X2 n=1 Tax=Sminthopsis crassicaudata TaxID=9301 RepID=UPI003D69AA0C
MHLLDKILWKSAGSPLDQIDQHDGAVHEGLLELEQNGLEVAKWVKCLVQLHKRQLTLYPLDFNEENEKTDLETNIVQLLDVRVHKENEHDEFSIQAKKDNYLFRIPATALIRKMEDATEMRDRWVTLISQYCAHSLTYPDHQSKFQDGSSCAETSLASKHEISKDGPGIFPGGKEKDSLLVADSSTTSLNVVPTFNYVSGSQRRTSIAQGIPGILQLQPCLSIVQEGPPLPASLPSVNPIPVTEKTKAFHWDIVPHDKIQKSIWSTCDPQKRKIDVTRLYDQFHTLNTPVMLNSNLLGSQHLLLDHKVAHNFSIFLRHFHLKPKELQGQLYILHEEAGGLAYEHITTLRRYVPTIKDIEMYHSYQGSSSELHLVDQFMLEMCKIPHLDQRLELLLMIRELPGYVKDLQPLLNQKIQACQQLKASQKFVAVLEYLLAIGNYLNEKAGKEKARGFRLSSLSKILLRTCYLHEYHTMLKCTDFKWAGEKDAFSFGLSLLRGKEKKFTLVHALVEQILLHQPHLAKFPQELMEFEDSPGASIKGLIAEVDVLRKELEKIIQYKKILKPKTLQLSEQESQFHQDLKDLIQKYEGDLCQLSKRCDEMKKLYGDILVNGVLKIIQINHTLKFL